MKKSIETENVIFGLLITAFVIVTFTMGAILYRTPKSDPAKTLKILLPASDDYILAQEKFTAAYKLVHPEITISPILFSHRDVWQKLEFLMVAGIPPDISNIQQPNLPWFVDLGTVEPLDDWIRKDPEFDLSGIFPTCLDEGNWNGKQYALPTQVSTVTLWYNKTLFDREGLAYPSGDWSLEDLMSAAKKLTKDFDGDGLVDQYGLYTDPNHWNRYPAWIWMQGGEFFSPDGMKCTFDEAKVVKSFQWLADLMLKDKVMPSMTFMGEMNQANLVLTGVVAMSTQTRFFMANIYAEKNRDKIGNYVFDVSELPHDARRATTMMLEQWIVPNGITDERKKMALDYLKFLVGPAGQEAVADINIALPVRRDAAERMVTRPGRPLEHDRAYLDAIAYGRYFYRPIPAEPIFQQLRTYFYGVWTGRLTAKEVCDRITSEANREIEKYVERYPDRRIPEQTKWVPFEQRAGQEGAGHADTGGTTSGN